MVRPVEPEVWDGRWHNYKYNILGFFGTILFMFFCCWCWAKIMRPPGAPRHPGIISGWFHETRFVVDSLRAASLRRTSKRVGALSSAAVWTQHQEGCKT